MVSDEGLSTVEGPKFMKLIALDLVFIRSDVSCVPSEEVIERHHVSSLVVLPEPMPEIKYLEAGIQRKSAYTMCSLAFMYIFFFL